MIFDVLSKIKREVNIMMWLTIILALLIVSGVYTYARYTYHKEVTSISVKIPATSCSSLGLSLSDCVIAFEGGIEDIDRAKANIEAKGEPDFSVTATTDEGLYAASDDYGTSYYYRGAIDDNYVEYAGYLWRIVRINGDGSVRIIMEDVLDYVAYNDDYDSPKYVGYTYGNDDSDEETMRENDNDSTIKQYIDEWYATNIEGTEYESYLSDELFCNDRTLSTDYTWSNFVDDLYGEYSSYQRLNNLDIYSPTLKCSNQLDQFTTAETTLDDGTAVGNGYLKYPIGLITADEVVMAGNTCYYVNHEHNTDYYLYNNDYWWTMTPAWFDDDIASVWGEFSGNLAVSSVDDNYGARPVINLSSEVYVTSGKGTYDEPYEVALYDNRLSSVMLTNSTGTSIVEAAIEEIEEKGTPDFSSIAPAIASYTDNLLTRITTATANSRSMSSYSSRYYTYASSYTFDASTGKYTLVNPSVGKYSSIYSSLGGKYIVSYSGSTSSSAATSTNLSTIYYVTTSTSSTYLYYISSSTTTNYDETDAGLYAAEDDYGTSYYYRGAVEDNYVEYAGYIWRIIRRNGDGSVRMIYDGTTAHANGESNTDRYYKTSAFNTYYANNSLVGYMYGNLTDNKATSTTSVSMSSSRSYYYATSYTYDSTTGYYKLSGTTTSGVWSSIYSDVISTYPYTCKSTSSTGTCTTLYELTAYSSSTSATGYAHKLGTSYDETHTNTNSSTIKTVIDTFYEEKLDSSTDGDGNKYSAYLSDTLFCNDRSTYSGDGYGTVTTYYSGYNRLNTNKSPTLTCTNQNDEFTVETTTLEDDTKVGNAALSYPIGLITADEVAMAGGVYNTSNSGYYLYMGSYYWTMTPYYFDGSYAREFIVYSPGSIYDNYVNGSDGARPVVNISSSVLVTSGDGTADKPYELALPS